MQFPWWTFRALVLAAAALLAAGCSTMRTTDPQRTASEQFLMTTAVTRAVEQLSAAGLRDRIVWVDPTYLATAEQQFLIAEFRARLLGAGVRLAPKRETAQVVVEVRSAGVGIDRYDFLLGIPSIVFPSLATGSNGNAGLFATPEIAIIKNVRQQAYASVAFVAYWAETGELIASSGPHLGQSIRRDYWFMGVGPRSTGTVPTVQPEER